MDVHLRRVSMQFHHTKVIEDMNLSIRSGELVCLLGPSGCGKSTTLFMLAGLHQCTAGEIYFGDEMMNRKGPEQRDIGMVFQNYALYPHMTVLKNIMFPLKMSGVPKGEALKRAEEMAEMVQIRHLLDRKPGQLSGGQQQRVAIARALVKRPQLLLMDEPFSNLDAGLRIEMREEVRRIQREVGITTLFVTHDQEEAMSVSNRIILMNQGRIQQYATPAEIYQKPANVFAAGFIGTPKMNFIEFGAAAGNVLLGIRPEDWIWGADEPLLHGKVHYIETIGRETLVKLRWGEKILTALAGPACDLSEGDEVALGFRPERAHWFDASTGQRLPAGQEPRFGTGAPMPGPLAPNAPALAPNEPAVSAEAGEAKRQ